MPSQRPWSLLLAGLCAASLLQAQDIGDWPAEVDPAAYPAPSVGELLLIGGDLSDGNYGGGRVRSDGALQHLAGRHYSAGSGWWTLACRGEDCRLLPVNLQVEDRPHPTYDGPTVPGQLLRLVGADAQSASFLQRPAGDSDAGSRARTTQDVVILAAFRPSGRFATLPLQSGPLATSWYAAPRNTEAVTAPHAYALLPPPERQILLANQQVLTLRQRLPDSSDANEVELQVEYAGLQQSLGTRYIHAVGETAPVELGEVLQWVGDLDGDGRPDLLINHTGYWWDVALWLSSLAKPGELVGEAGRFQYAPPDSPGC